MKSLYIFFKNHTTIVVFIVAMIDVSVGIFVDIVVSVITNVCHVFWFGNTRFFYIFLLTSNFSFLVLLLFHSVVVGSISGLKKCCWLGTLPRINKYQ